MVTSFINEHSSEFVLVPQFTSILSSAFKEIIPVYFWASREGSRIALDCLQGINLRIVAMYARRPKVNRPDQEDIYVKFNSIIFERAEYFEQHGIPVFSGVPRTSSLMDLKLDTACSWFSISGDSENTYDAECFLDKKTGRIKDESFLYDQVEPVDQGTIINLVQKKSRVILWEEATKIIRGIPPDDSRWYFRSNYSSYKPVFFLIRS